MVLLNLMFLCAHYGALKISQGGLELTFLMNTEKTRNEWVVFRQLMSANFKACKYTSNGSKTFKLC